MTNIIVVDDDGDLRKQVVDYLALSGFAVAGVGSAGELYRRLAVAPCDIIVLDLRLPDEDGLSIARHLRGQQGIGIIMLTARGSSDDRVQGFEAGADIYMPKPIDLRELAAAARSLVRRLETEAPPRVANGSRWEFDAGAFLLIAPNGRTVPLTATEVALLRLLTSAEGRVVARGDLLASMGHDPQDPGNRCLDAAIRRLRLKAENSSGQALPVRTVQAVGYMFRPGLPPAT